MPKRITKDRMGDFEGHYARGDYDDGLEKPLVRELLDALTAERATADKMRKALVQTSNGYGRCLACEGAWHARDPERHAPGCVAEKESS